MSYDERKNYLTGNVLSDEWYTPDNVVKYIYNNFNTKNKKIICPYDTEKSNFVKYFSNSTYNINDFLESDYEYDICITNPPFSLKEKVLEKILKDKKEAILILPQTFLYSVTFYELLEKYRFFYEVIIPKKRIYFYDEKGNQNRPNFHSIIFHLKEYNILEFGRDKYTELEE
jgi:hypothetical protein